MTKEQNKWLKLQMRSKPDNTAKEMRNWIKEDINVDWSVFKRATFENAVSRNMEKWRETGSMKINFFCLFQLFQIVFSGRMSITGKRNSKQDVVWNKSKKDDGELLDHALEKFDQDMELCRRLMKSIPKRLEAVLKVGGKQIRRSDYQDLDEANNNQDNHININNNPDDAALPQ